MTVASPMVRMWINQPSTLQPDHAEHGKNVLVAKEDLKHEIVRVWFMSGDVISMQVFRLALSKGWR